MSIYSNAAFIDRVNTTALKVMNSEITKLKAQVATNTSEANKPLSFSGTIIVNDSNVDIDIPSTFANFTNASISFDSSTYALTSLSISGLTINGISFDEISYTNTLTSDDTIQISIPISFNKIPVGYATGSYTKSNAKTFKLTFKITAP